jgi:hypothetical protein
MISEIVSAMRPSTAMLVVIIISTSNLFGGEARFAGGLVQVEACTLITNSRETRVAYNSLLNGRKRPVREAIALKPLKNLVLRK